MTEQQRVEKVADALAQHCHEPRGTLLMMARAAIAALTVTPQEAAKVLLKWSEKETPAAILLDAGWTDQQATTASAGMEFMLRAISEDSQ